MIDIEECNRINAEAFHQDKCRAIERIYDWVYSPTGLCSKIENNLGLVAYGNHLIEMDRNGRK